MNKEKLGHLSQLARFEESTHPIYKAKAGNRTIPLFKTLLTSKCQNECKFCINRASRNCSRYSMKPEEMAAYALNLYEKGLVHGVFLSSALDNDPETVSRREVKTAKILREEGFKEYIHLRLMPGCSLDTIKQASKVADRVGINLEAPNSVLYNELKVSEIFDFKTGIMKRMKWLCREYRELGNSRSYGNLSAGIDTQFIVGAAQDQDKEFLKVTEELYTKYDLERVYFSAFDPVPRTPLENKDPCPREREHRLYQASFLLKDYNFSYDDLIYNENGNLVKKEPKKAFAEAHDELFPVDINSASYRRLCIVPGIGPATAQNIIEKRPIQSLKELKTCGPKIRKSLKFITFPKATLPHFLK